MAHYIMLVDSYTNFHQCFRIFMDKRGKSDKYKHPWGVKMREIKLYDVVCAEEDEAQFLQDIKHFEYERGYIKESNRVVRWIGKFLKRFFKIQLIDMSKVKPTNFTREEKRVPPYEWFAYTKMIGKVPDFYDEKTGEELI